MGNFGALEIGKRALIAQRFGMDVTSNNIANVNTPGYARQRVEFGETDPQLLPGGKGYIGSGVEVANVRLFREEYFDREIRNNLSKKSGFENDSSILSRVETILKEPSDDGIDATIDKFFNSFQELANQPESIARREFALNQAQSLVDEFNGMSARFTELRSQVSEKITTSTDEVNRIIERITELNNKLTPLVSLGSDAGATIINERARAVEQLSALVGPVNASVDTKGLMSVSVNGASIISTVIGHKVQVSETTSSSGERTLSMQVVSRASGDVISKFNPGAGEIASNLKHYNVTLDGNDSSGGFSIVKSLDELAGAIVNKVNTVAQTGYGLDDVTAPNRNIFDPTGTTAASIKLDAAVLNQPRNLPISIEAGTPGDNTIARQIAALADDPTFVNAQTAQQFYANTLNRVATAGADAANGAKTTSLVNDQLNAQRESVIGVNLDEEALSLIRYQRAFEAAARIVNTTNELLGTLINLGR